MFRKITLLAMFCASFGFVVSPVAAQSGLEEFVYLEVLDGGLTRRGTHSAALRVVLADGWKTYWRAPGDTGIPPRIDWNGSRNVGQVAVTWPTPQVFDQDAVRTIGYKHQMVLPLEITVTQPGQPVQLSGEIEFGLCEDICVPAVLSFDLTLDPGAPRSPAIAAALAERPFSATEAGVKSTICHVTPSDNGLTVEAFVTMPTAGGPEVGVIESGDSQLWASQAETTRQGDVLSIVSQVSHVSGSDFTLDHALVRITVLGQRHAVDIQGCEAG
jgi:DsbC/DsbD-like thiol-disulfide interchange protein